MFVCGRLNAVQQELVLTLIADIAYEPRGTLALSGHTVTHPIIPTSGALTATSGTVCSFGTTCNHLSGLLSDQYGRNQVDLLFFLSALNQHMIESTDQLAIIH